MLKPEITVTLFPRKKTADSEPSIDPLADYVSAAEKAAERLGKKLIAGTVVVAITTAVAATLGAISVEAVKHALNK